MAEANGLYQLKCGAENVCVFVLLFLLAALQAASRDVVQRRMNLIDHTP